MEYDEYKNNDDSNPFSIFEKNNIDFSFFNNNKESKNSINNLIENTEKLNIKEEQKKKKKLIPRDYQIKIYEKAKNQNSIIYVETGKGKTFISIMLMANFLGIDMESEKKPKIDKNKKIIFFVCDTALVDQQKNEISNILNIEVGTIQGKKDKKSKNDYEFFKRKWESLNIFVAIPSIIYKLLSCGFIKIFDISMIIFDECHHTADDHPYNKIMTEFYFFYKKKKELDNLNYPRIYGLTASPVKTGIKGNALEATAYDALQKLSENLDCSIVIDPEMINSNANEMRLGESIDHYLNEDIYIEVDYHINIKEYKTILVNLFNECFNDFINISFSSIKDKYPQYSNNDYIEQYFDYLKLKYKSNNLDEYNKITQFYSHLYNLRKYSPYFLIFEKLQRHIFMILENLCLDSLISFFEKLDETYNSLYQKKDEENYNYSYKRSISLNTSENDDEDDDEIDVSSLDPESIKELNNIYSKMHKKLKEVKESKDYISDRLKQLYNKIKDLFSQNDKSKFIIFIANRIVAHFLKPALSSFLKNNFKNKKCDEIIGINKKKSGGGTTLTPSLTLKKLNDIISEFNEDKFDILIGTSAIEEGLDIQSCNAVLALVELNTPKSFIQIKGRARKSNSYFYIFTNSAKEAKLKIKNFVEMGKKMNDLFDGNFLKDFRRKNYIYEKPDFFYDMDINSHSKITWGNVTMFFNEIKQQIESCGVTFTTKINLKKVKSYSGVPEYEFIGEISIKTNLNDVNKYFPYSTGKEKSKDNATKICHFYTLNVLKKLKYLDCHLKFCRNK